MIKFIKNPVIYSPFYTSIMNFLQIILQDRATCLCCKISFTWFYLVKHRETAVQIERINQKYSNAVTKQRTKKKSYARTNLKIEKLIQKYPPTRVSTTSALNFLFR